MVEEGSRASRVRGGRLYFTVCGVGYLDRGQQAGQEELALGQKMGGGRAAPRPVGKEKLRLDPVGT